MTARIPLVIISGNVTELPAGDSLPPSVAISPGLPGQLLQTNAGGTQVEWTSDIALSGSLAIGVISSGVWQGSPIVDTKLATITTAGKVANTATTAISTNTANAIVARDASGNFNAGTITASLNGNASTATSATTAGALSSTRTFALTGDVTGSVNSDLTSGASIATSIAAGSIVNADVNASAAIADTKLATISTAGKVSNSATTATNINTPNTIVARDGSGNFSAEIVTVSGLTASVVNATIINATVSGVADTATRLSSARTFALTGDVTGSVNSDLTSGASIATSIAAGSIVDADINASAAIADTKLATISTAGKVSNSATTATSANTASAIVARDASGNFSAGTITATLNGNANTATSATSATTATTAGALSSARTFALTGDVTGSVSSDLTSGASISTSIAAGSVVNADINASAAIADTKLATISTAGKVSNSATTATNTNTASAIVARDASGNFSAGTITATLNGNATTATSSSSAAVANALSSSRTFALTGDVTGSVSSDLTSGASIATSIAAGSIVDADINASAAIADTKLATISTAGKVSNSATTATSANTASAIVARDASGNFAANFVTVSGLSAVAGTPLSFSTNNAERARFSAIGNFGVGTFDMGGVGSRLDVATSGTGSNAIRSRNSVASVFLEANNGYTYLNTTTNTPFLIGTNDQERLRITSAGFVGIGTNSPDGQLAVSASAPLQVGFNAGSLASPVRGNLFWNTDGSGWQFRIGKFQSGTFTPQMTFVESGNVGINTTSPAQTLHVNGNAVVGGSPAASYSNFTVAGDIAIQSAAPLLNFVNAAGATRFGYIYHTGTGGTIDIVNQQNGGLTLGTNNTERVRVDSSGRLLIGTVSDSGGALLQVNGDRIRVGTAKTPASATATGTTGEICWDASYVYVCIATNTWKRSALSTW